MINIWEIVESGDHPPRMHGRFHQKAVPDYASGCWMWSCQVNPKGYGRFRINGKRMVLAHRLAWVLWHNKDPGDKLVMHSCDNPGCVNPEHLSLGTNQDNMDDMMAKGRAANNVGERNPRSKLTVDDVVEIRQRSADGASRADLAREYGVTSPLISMIALRKIWKHVPADFRTLHS